jgi:hypothetical protein
MRTNSSTPVDREKFHLKISGKTIPNLSDTPFSEILLSVARKVFINGRHRATVVGCTMSTSGARNDRASRAIEDVSEVRKRESSRLTCGTATVAFSLEKISFCA